ncbi:uroporphyrinogen decarboxylase family protein [Acetobacterium tundrae]|uniref:Uroporphyrinogen decarboxylase n=1 Tax=Acetobacterium tundrae TaxID=132932 RepID=A0ABR6WL00_9FIRM|nr:uroporphyrinogen decarboxylase family protein [Acetobacterium tundrae]MBC3796926.1 uroporphyrinogen decarboxylase [Acetobacterium tundrae]
MTDNIKNLKEERTQLFTDLYTGTIPKRIPISASLPIELMIAYSGKDLGKTQWNREGMKEIYEKSFEITCSDAYPASFSRYPAHFHLLESKSFVMGSSGIIQHPEVSGMFPEDYDDFINNPYDCLMERIFPRLYPALNTDPIHRSMVLAKAMKAYYDYIEFYGAMDRELIDKHGFFVAPPGSSTGVTTPFDFLSDFPRGFKGISMDIKRCPEKIIEACEAILPLSIKKGTPMNPSPLGANFIALHMATYLRTKDFEKFYWPTFYKLVHALAEKGQTCVIFCEDNWMRYLDYLYELPQGTRFYFEYGDPKLVKEKLGKKHIISGFYPISYLKTATKEQCVDKAKELIDILAPGGNYWFNFDKSPCSLSTIDPENYLAVLEYVRDNGKYDNSGEKVWTNPREDSIDPVLKNIPEFKSKYYTPYAEFKKTNPAPRPDLDGVVGEKMQQYEELLFGMLMMLC